MFVVEPQPFVAYGLHISLLTYDSFAPGPMVNFTCVILNTHGWLVSEYLPVKLPQDAIDLGDKPTMLIKYYNNVVSPGNNAINPIFQWSGIVISQCWNR